jgi:hypothetical protein
LRDDARDRRNRHHHADPCFVPLLFGQEVDREIGPKAIAHVGKKEVGRIERLIGSPNGAAISSFLHRCPVREGR